MNNGGGGRDFLKKLVMCLLEMLKDSLVLISELIKYIGHCEEFLKLMFQAVAQAKTYKISLRNSLQWEELTVLTQLLKPNYLLYLD